MSKLLIDEVPDNCYHCEFTYEDSYLADRCQFHCGRVGDCREERHEKCPLKSISGLIEKLTVDIQENQDASLQEYRAGVYRAIDIVKEYCEVEA